MYACIDELLSYLPSDVFSGLWNKGVLKHVREWSTTQVATQSSHFDTQHIITSDAQLWLFHL